MGDIMAKSELTTEDKLKIANSGGQFQESGKNSWVGTKIRKGQKTGVVTCDMNGAWRILTVRFDDGTEEQIKMNNVGEDPTYIHEYEWLHGDKWFRF